MRPTLEPDDNACQTPTETDLDEEPASSVRVVKPTVSASDDDLVSRAVRGTRMPSTPVSRSTPNPQRWRIPQSACGELTGSISGSVWCYGWAVHAGVCVFVNMGGPRMAVEAIRAKLSKGDIVNCVPWDGPSVELTAGEGETGMYTAYLQTIPEAKFASLILCHEWLTLPNYNGKVDHLHRAGNRGASRRATASPRDQAGEGACVPRLDRLPVASRKNGDAGASDAHGRRRHAVDSRLGRGRLDPVHYGRSINLSL